MLGDDIGLEVVPEAVRVMGAAAGAEGLSLTFTTLPIGWSSYLESGSTLPAQTLEGLAGLEGFLLGPIGHAAYPKTDPNCINPHPVIRKHFDLYANHRPTRSVPGLTPIQGIDLLIVRENNEGFQPDRNMIAGSGEFQATEDAAFSIRVITRQGSERVARAAFEAARRRGLKRRVTAIHKRTVFKLTDGLFMKTVEEVAAGYPDIRLEHYQVDTFAMHLVMRPQEFDVVLCTNLFGDILSDCAAMLAGSLGMLPSASVGARRDERGRRALYEPIHGSAPDIAGMDKSNPMATILSLSMMMRYTFGREDLAARVDHAVRSVLAAGLRTGDIADVNCQLVGTKAMGDAIVSAI